ASEHYLFRVSMAFAVAGTGLSVPPVRPRRQVYPTGSDDPGNERDEPTERGQRLPRKPVVSDLGDDSNDRRDLYQHERECRNAAEHERTTRMPLRHACHHRNEQAAEASDEQRMR